MLNTYLRLVVIVAVVLVALGILAILVPLLIKAAVLAAIVLGILFLINVFKRKMAVRTRPGPPQYLG